MKKYNLLIIIAVITLSSCKVTKKMDAYKGIYEEKPVTILLMPPINNSTNVDAKEYFHSTLNVPISSTGYYVIPPFLSMEILKQESAYDSEMFLDMPLNKFKEIFGADMVLFTIINKWDKSSIASRVVVEIEYIFKSTTTNKIVYNRKGKIVYNASVNLGLGFIGNALASAANTAATNYVDVGRVCNAYTFQDLPVGKYSPRYELDGSDLAGEKEFKVKLDSKY
ncbi:GNA1162 family protein [Yeosuana sp. AK3]